jgi:hypothetical protein
MECIDLIRARFLPTPLYRQWVWGKGSQMLWCKGPLGVIQSPLILSLTVEVTYLFHPLLHIIFVIPMIVNDVNLSIAFRGVTVA